MSKICISIDKFPESCYDNCLCHSEHWCNILKEDTTAVLGEWRRLDSCPLQSIDEITVSSWVNIHDKTPKIKVGDPEYTGYLVYSNGHIQVADWTCDRYFPDVLEFYVDGEYDPDVELWMKIPKITKFDK